MEDGSAAPMEAILVQSGSLGFYQKRLFLCSCFLQALTVTALVYASHCRPDISSTSPRADPAAAATNGALVYGHKCRIRATAGPVVVPRNVSWTGPPSLNETYPRGAGRVAGPESGAGVDTQPTQVSFDDPRDGLHGETRVSASVEGGQGADGTSSVNVHAKVQSTSTSPHAHSAVTTTRPLLRDDESVTSHVDVTSEGYDFKAKELRGRGEYVNDDAVVEDSSDGAQHTDLEVSTASISARRIYDSRSDGQATGSDVSSSQHFSDIKDTDGSDVTVSSSTSHQSCDEGQGEEREGGALVYLSKTYLPAPQWLGETDGVRLSHYGAYCQAVGAMLGAAVGAMGADQVGRRRPLYVYLVLLLVSHGLSGAAVSWTMLAVLRFLVGVFAGACAVVSLVFPLESVGTEWRDACVCSGMWVLGVVVISLELLVTRHWRFLAFLSGGIGLPLLGTYFIASESARWLLCHQQFPSAESTLKEIISCNATCVPDFLSLFDKSRACVVTNMHPKRYTFLDLFHSIEMTKWTVALVYTCLVASSVYFCLLAKVKAMTGNIYLDTSIPFVIDLPLCWSAVVVNRCLGRRWCLFLYAVASGLVLLSVLVLHMTGNLTHVPSMITGMAVFGKVGVTASLALVFVIAVEMYPTVVRCMGVAVGVIGVSGGFLLAEVFSFLESSHYTVPFIAFGALMSSVGFAGLLFPETLRRPLPNILPCRHRTIPLHEGVRLVTNPWDVL